MKILLTVHQFFPEHSSGTEVLTRSVAHNLLARGHDVRVFTGMPTSKALSPAQRVDAYEFEGLHVYRFHSSVMPMTDGITVTEQGYNNTLADAYFAEILSCFKPDLIHCFHLHLLGSRLIDMAASRRLPITMTPTDFWSVCPMGQLLLSDGRMCTGPSAAGGNCMKHFAETWHLSSVRFAAKWVPTLAVDAVVRLAQAHLVPVYSYRDRMDAVSARLKTNVGRLNKLKKIISPNHLMTDILVHNGVAKTQILESSYGIDTTQPAHDQARRALTSTHTLPSRPLHIGFIGTLAPHKGCHVLIDAFKALPAGTAVLNIYGDLYGLPAYAEQLQASAGGRPDIRFCGTFPNAQIANIMAGIDVLVVPSMWYENTPLVIYSAQAAGCPVIASDCPGISVVVDHEVNGLLFKAGNAAALCQQLSRAATDEGLIDRLSVACKPPKSTSQYVDELLEVWTTP